ncbi:murein transglycosylase domain-containing protein [Persephonella sp.]
MRGLLVLMLSGLLFLTYAEDDYQQYLNEFQQFKEEELKEYQQYYKEIMKEFEEYKRITYEEFERYKKEISQYWKEAEISTKKKWVEYSDDYRIKKAVDFEKGEIKVEIRDVKKPSKKDLARILMDLITEDTKKAFERDKLSQRIEKRITEKAKHIKKGKVKPKPILLNVVVDKKEPRPEDISKAVVSLLRSGRVVEKPSKIKGEKVYSFRVKLPPKRFIKKAKEYKPVVTQYSEKYGLNHALVFAIIHTESSFNPLARSPVPAYGLMQIVPSTAGKDATKLIYGRPVLLAPSYLYDEEKNIMVGTTYIYILYYNYLKDIKHPLSRLYCTIAAYNTGAGNVARAFTGTINIKKAAKVINRMSPSEVYDTLMRKLPYDETKNYLKKVTQRIIIYNRI